MSDQWIRASEISSYVYCQRAWWLQRVPGYSPENTHELTAGTRYHQAHGRFVQRAVWARRLAFTLLGLAVAFLAVTILMG